MRTSSSRFSRWVASVALAAACLLFLATARYASAQESGKFHDQGGAAPACLPEELDSPYIPVDSWVYPAVLRLYGLGFVDEVFLNNRPWKRSTVEAILEQVAPQIEDADASAETDQAEEIYESLMHEFASDMGGPCLVHHANSAVDQVYTVARSISGTPLRDSYHLGSTLVNDYGRPYAKGFNNYSGFIAHTGVGRIGVFARGELQASPSDNGYSPVLAQTLSALDGTYGALTNNVFTRQMTIPESPIASNTRMRLLNAYVSAHVIGHEISLGKQDHWWGPGVGGAMAYSNNAENIYGLDINRTDGFLIPGVSRLTGPFRWEFVVGELRGHDRIDNPAYQANPKPTIANVITPGNPWLHMQKISFRPTPNLEFGFSRAAIWGGKGHAPITLHSFLKSFLSFSNVTAVEKLGRNDPGARFSSFDFSYRLPFVRNWLTLYTDSAVHDDISALDAPRRGAWHPGIYLTHVPGVPRLDLRAEASMTQVVSQTRGSAGTFMYYETIQRQGFTNNGQLMGDWMGREAKGGQMWLTYHLSGNEWIQANYRRQKASRNFIHLAGSPALSGTTLDDIGFQAVKRIGKSFEVNGSFTLERYKAPIYLTGQQTVTTTNIQLTWFPSRKVNF